MPRGTCPVCGAYRPEKTIFMRDFKGAREIMLFASYEVVNCPQCGMCYASNIEESMPAAEYYDILSKYTSGTYAEFGGVTERHRKLAGYLLGMVPLEYPILDIGCADGSLLQALKLEGYRNLCGLEAAKDNVRHARQEYHLDVHEGALGGDVSAIALRQFGLIIMEGVLEHIIPVSETLEFCKAHLWPGGMMFLGVPDVGQFCDDVNLFQQFSVEHVNYFTNHSLTNLMITHGFETVEIRQDLLPLELNGLYKFTGVQGLMEKDEVGYADMLKYVEQGTKLLERLRFRLQSVKPPYYVWGAGTHTTMLYQAGILCQKNVVGIIDSNRNYQGRHIFGVEIICAEHADKDLPIIISSKDAQAAIKDYALNKLHWAKERLITLY